MTEVLTIGEVSRRLSVSPERVRQYVADGRLKTATTTVRGLPAGYRLFDIREVERFAAEREKRSSKTKAS